MVWSKFTVDYIHMFNKCKYNLNTNNILLNNMRTELDMINIFISSNKIKFKITEKLFSNKIGDYLESKFVHKSSVINNLYKIPDEYLIEWDNNKIYIKTTETFFKHFIKRINTLILLLEYLRTKNNNIDKKIEIYLILTDLVKILPNKKTDTLSAEYVNSGYTDSNIIFIWRHEEFEKVIFHEIIHYFDLDCDNSFQINIDIMKKNNDTEYYSESITDFYGICYHLMYISIVSKIEIKELLELELGFIKNQAQLLNNLYKLNNWNYKNKIIINHKTSAFSYYIIKYLLFEYMLIHDYYLLNNPNKILNDILKIGFRVNKFININSLRMTFLQLH